MQRSTKLFIQKTIVVICVAIIIICFGVLITKQIKENHDQDDPMLDRLKFVLIPVHPVIKTLDLYKADKSYTINKQKIYLCVKDKNGEYYPLNMLVYVALHEIAHLLNTYDVGHTEKFHEIFNQLLERAQKLGIYNPSIPIIQNYSD